MTPHLTFAKHSKRGRDEFQSDQNEHEASLREAKKNARSLPFRASPIRPARPTVIPPQQPFLNISSHMLTPAESSDDELIEYENASLGSLRALEQDHPQESSGSSASSIRAQAGEDDDPMDMSISPSPEPAVPALSSPIIHREYINQAFLQVPDYSNQPRYNISDRLPTPIYPTFRNLDIDVSGSNHLPMLRTRLSPTFGGDTPSTAQTGRPSPASEADERMNLSPVGHPSAMMSTLDLNQAGSGSRQVAGSGFEGQNESLTPRRIPRLHMGYRADCEKCQQRVPGHYSHILWS